MSEYSMVSEAVQLGAVMVSCVDLSTGELLFDASTASPGGGAPRGGAGEAGGLSNPHICTGEKPGSASFWVGGGLLKCAKPSIPFAQQGGGKRAKIKGFSSASRRRLMYMMGKIQRAQLPTMITLTYPAEFPTEGAVWKNHLRRWWQRLERRLPGVGGIWKLEPQKRGAPHFHLLVWGADKVDRLEFRCWVAHSWYKVVASGDKRHLVAGTRVEAVRDRRGVMAYAAKYLGKKQEIGVPGWQEPGRFWGVKGGENIPWADVVMCAVTRNQAVKLLRLMRRAIHCRRGNLPGLTMLSNNPDFWLERFRQLII